MERWMDRNIGKWIETLTEMERKRGVGGATG